MSTSAQLSTWRTWLYHLLVTLFVLGMITSSMAIWADVRVQQSDAWARTVGPLADDTAVQEFVVEQAGSIIERQIAADETAGHLQSFTRSQLSGLVRVAINDFVESPTFTTWWTEANRAAHGVVMHVIHYSEGDLLQAHGGDLVLDLQPIADWVNGHLESLFPRSGYSITLPPERSMIVLYSSDALQTTAQIIDLVDTLAFVLPVMTLIALVGAILLKRNFGLPLTQIALSLATGMVVALVLANVLRWWVVSQQPSTHRDVLDAVIRIVLVDLMSVFRAIAILALLRAGIVILLRSRYVNNPKVRAFIRENREAIAAGAIGIALILLVASNYPPMWLSLLAVAVIIGCAVQIFRWRNETSAPRDLKEKPAEP